MKPRFNWRHQYDEERDTLEGQTAGLECKDESLTQQHFAQDADINVLAKRFGLTGIPMSPPDLTAFRDTTNDPDLRDILEYRREAINQFNLLPAKLRARFHNSPTEMWHFVNDTDNAEEAVRLGLLSRIPETTSQAENSGPKATQSATSSDHSGATTSASSAPGTTTAPEKASKNTSGDTA